MRKLQKYDFDWLKGIKKYRNVLINNEISKEKVKILNRYLGKFNKKFTMSEERKFEVFLDIVLRYDTESIINKQFDNYYATKSMKDKLLIRRGFEYVKIFSNKLSIARKRKRGTDVSHFQVDFWRKNGYSKQESIKKVFEIQSKNSIKRHANYKLKRKKYKQDNPISNEYWLNLGYTKEESEILRKPYLEKCDTSLEGYIRRFGFKIGTQKYEKGILKRKQSIIKKYGKDYDHGNHVSKESLKKFFIPLYKKIRKLKISKDDIIWGIAKRKEKFLYDEELRKIYFYDFVIESKKIIVEYNNGFWHTRVGRKWRGFGSFEEKFLFDERKNNLAINCGYKVFIVWDDDDLIKKQKEILDAIR